MERNFGGREFHYQNNQGQEKTVRINDDDLYDALRQIQTFEDYETSRQAEEVVVIYSRPEWIETLNQLKCDPREYWNSNKFTADEIYTKIIESDVDGVMPILNGSGSESRKADQIEQACTHYDILYLDKPREELEEKNKADGFDSIINWLEELGENNYGAF